jgi:hypothetical protein
VVMSFARLGFESDSVGKAQVALVPVNYRPVLSTLFDQNKFVP